MLKGWMMELTFQEILTRLKGKLKPMRSVAGTQGGGRHA